MAANTFLTPEVIARAALGILQRDIVLPKLVYRAAEANFGTGLGSVINIRRPATLTGGGVRTYTQAARNAGTEVVFDNAEETSIPITIDTMLYKGVKVTDEDFTMNLRDFGQQVLAPQVRIVAEGAEQMIIDQMETIASDLEIDPDGSDLHAQIIEARRLLNAQFVPFGGRILLISPEVESLLLLDTSNRLVRYDATGQPGTPALREATIGRLYGFDVVVSSLLEAGSAIAFTREAFAFVGVAPVVPEGVTFGRSIASDGLAMRYIRDYDARFTQDRSLVSMFAGTDTLDANRVVRLTAAAP